jgi:hypothetical protein
MLNNEVFESYYVLPIVPDPYCYFAFHTIVIHHSLMSSHVYWCLVLSPVIILGSTIYITGWGIVIVVQSLEITMTTS